MLNLASKVKDQEIKKQEKFIRREVTTETSLYFN